LIEWHVLHERPGGYVMENRCYVDRETMTASGAVMSTGYSGVWSRTPREAWERFRKEQEQRIRYAEEDLAEAREWLDFSLVALNDMNVNDKVGRGYHPNEQGENIMS
jgi:hypothetical protein